MNHHHHQKEESTMSDKNTNTAVQADNTPNREATRNPEHYISPLVDIYETKDELCVVAEMPGVDREGLNIRVENGILTIEGRMKTHELKDCTVRIREFRALNFFRQFELPEAIDQEKIRAELKHGVLSLTLPKQEKQKPRQIPISVG